jgi:Protein of unknown function (DUF1566)
MEHSTVNRMQDGRCRGTGIRTRVLAVACILMPSLLLPAASNAACPSLAGRFTVSGAEVTDSRTGLIWARCSAGQSLSGTACTGTANTYTHEQALTYAKSQSGWRLPNVKELAGLADKGCQNPAIDSSTAFPNTVSSAYWSSSPYVVHSDSAWVVNFDGGTVYRTYRSYGGYVRLVRWARSAIAVQI